MTDAFNTNSKLLHYFRHKKVGQPTVGLLRTNEEIFTHDSKLMADLFANAFVSVFSDQHLPNLVEHQMCNISNTEFDVCSSGLT